MSSQHEGPDGFIQSPDEAYLADPEPNLWRKVLLQDPVIMADIAELQAELRRRERPSP